MPNNSPTRVIFDYSTDPNLTTGLLKAKLSSEVVTGSELVSIDAVITNLQPNSTYFFRVTGENEVGKSTGIINSFKTLLPPVQAPVPTLSASSSITSYSATLNGYVKPGNSSTTVTFLYSTDSSFLTNSITVVASPNTVNGGSEVPVSVNLTLLKEQTTYYFK